MSDMLLHITVGLVFALVCRKPARRMFGAGPAFTLWLLPPLLAMLPYLPAVPSTWAVTPTIIVLPATRNFIARAISPASETTHGVVMLLWITGAVFCLLRLAFHYARLIRQSRPLPKEVVQTLLAEQADIDVRRLRLHIDGPGVLWTLHGLLLLPPDFLERFDSAERRLVLRHEVAHLCRGDTWWSLLAELTFALLWFHPLAWLAMPRFRLDQELACDEHVLRNSPQEETAYANTLMHSIGMDTTPVLIPWLAEPQLKERLTMIQRLRPGALRRRVGFIALASLMLGGALVAQAGTDGRSIQSAEPDLNYNANIPPQYPPDAVKNREQGMVILTVLVGTDGKAHKIVIDPASQASPSLIKAASDAVTQWHFNPEMKNGKPVAAYARVPVKFALPNLATKAPAPPPPPPPAPPVPPPQPPSLPPPPPVPIHASPSL